MVELKEIIFIVEEYAEGGFTTRALGESIFTEAATMDELRTAIRDALKCHFNTEADIPRIIRLHHVHDEVLLYA